MLLLSLLLPISVIRAQQVDFSSSNLPIIVIDTFGQNIIDSRKIDALMGIIYNGQGKRNALTDPFNEYDGKIGIELRGSSSLQFPKKQFAVETRDSLGNNLNVSLFGMPEENDWVLYDPYSDKSLIRNVLIYKISNDMGRYASRTRLCELVLNGEYWGVYVLMEKIKRDRGRVNISAMDSADVAGDNLTGGYIIKVDKTAGESIMGWNSPYPPAPGVPRRVFYQYHYPKPSDITPEQKDYIKNVITRFETEMNGAGYADPGSGYAKYLDVDSFVDHFILNEVSKNVDAYRLSAYMYKDRDSKGGKIVMGPIWDFNLAFGNADYYSAFSPYGWILEFFYTDDQFHQSDAFVMPFWWWKLWQDDNFKVKVYKRWWQLRYDVLNVDILLNTIDSLVDTLQEAQVRNFQKWPVLSTYVWPNAYVGGSYENEIRYLKEWIEDRIEWIDDNLYIIMTGINNRNNTESSVPARFSLEQNYPNPFNSQTVLSYRLAESAEIVLEIFNPLGQKVKTLLKGQASAGIHTLVWDGKNDRGSALPSGVYTCQLKAGSQVFYEKMLLLR
jgi:hypothetical protein